MLSHSQFEALRAYPTLTTQRVVYRAGGHPRSLLANGYLVQDSDGSVKMTDAGRLALIAYRERYGIREAS